MCCQAIGPLVYPSIYIHIIHWLCPAANCSDRQSSSQSRGRMQRRRVALFSALRWLPWLLANKWIKNISFFAGLLIPLKLPGSPHETRAGRHMSGDLTLGTASPPLFQRERAHRLPAGAATCRVALCTVREIIGFGNQSARAGHGVRRRWDKHVRLQLDHHNHQTDGLYADRWYAADKSRPCWRRRQLTGQPVSAAAVKHYPSAIAAAVSYRTDTCSLTANAARNFVGKNSVMQAACPRASCLACERYKATRPPQLLIGP